MRAAIVPGLACLALVVIAIVWATSSITRPPEFHHYADQRTWLGLPHVGDVVSNLAFVIVALRASWPGVPGTTGVRLGIAAIGIGSAAYHVAPGDTLLAFDWAPIAVTLSLLAATVIRDRAGESAGRIAFVVAPALAIGSVSWWLATGGTHGGNMAPYVAVQATGIALPPLVALVAPGQVRVGWLLAGVVGFLLARFAAANDRALLDAIGCSGHSLKHLLAAAAAGCALRALASAAPQRDRSPSRATTPSARRPPRATT